MTKSAKFQRGLKPEIIDMLKNDPLFLKKLKGDCEKGDVFPAVRGGYMSFYYKGGSLFTYDYKPKMFATHIKYALVPTEDTKDNYVTSEELRNAKLEHNFVQAYESIKRRCELHAGNNEAAGMSKLYKFSPVSKVENLNRFYLVDIEIAFTADNDERKRKTTDRIDILLYDNDEKRLLFCEAKHFSNGDVRAGKNRTPAVVPQLARYNDQIEEKKEQILEQYAQHFEVLHDLFGVNLNPPEKIYPFCGLLLFGFDDDQKKGRLKKHLHSLEGHKFYTIGDPAGISAETLYKELIK